VLEVVEAESPGYCRHRSGQDVFWALHH